MAVSQAESSSNAAGPFLKASRQRRAEEAVTKRARHGGNKRSVTSRKLSEIALRRRGCGLQMRLFS
jgi:hypothetical protein